MPRTRQILEPEFFRRAETREVKFILRAADVIHSASIPVAILRLALRTKARPDAKLRIAEPFRCLVLLERCPSRRKFTRSHRLVGRVHDHRWNRSRRYRFRASQTDGHQKRRGANDI